MQRGQRGQGRTEQADKPLTQILGVNVQTQIVFYVSTEGDDDLKAEGVSQKGPEGEEEGRGVPVHHCLAEADAVIEGGEDVLQSVGLWEGVGGGGGVGVGAGVDRWV